MCDTVVDITVPRKTPRKICHDRSVARRKLSCRRCMLPYVITKRSSEEQERRTRVTPHLADKNNNNSRDSFVAVVAYTSYLACRCIADLISQVF